MKISQQVITLEQAKRLEDLGLKCEHPAYHWIFDSGMKWELHPDGYYNLNEEGIEYYPAYTVAELGEMLPTDSDGAGTYYTWKGAGEYMGKDIEGYSVWYANKFRSHNPVDLEHLVYPTEAQARGALLIHLIETAIINPLTAK